MGDRRVPAPPGEHSGRLLWTLDGSEEGEAGPRSPRSPEPAGAQVPPLSSPGGAPYRFRTTANFAVLGLPVSWADGFAAPCLSFLSGIIAGSPVRLLEQPLAHSRCSGNAGCRCIGFGDRFSGARSAGRRLCVQTASAGRGEGSCERSLRPVIYKVAQPTLCSEKSALSALEARDGAEAGRPGVPKRSRAPGPRVCLRPEFGGSALWKPAGTEARAPSGSLLRGWGVRASLPERPLPPAPGLRALLSLR